MQILPFDKTIIPKHKVLLIVIPNQKLLIYLLKNIFVRLFLSLNLVFFNVSFYYKDWIFYFISLFYVAFLLPEMNKLLVSEKVLPKSQAKYQ